MSREKIPGIFCVEGDWSSRLTDRASVRDMLELLESVDRIRFIYEHVSTSTEAFFEALQRWRERQYASYSIGYFAFHGKPGKLLLGRKSVTLDKLADVLKGACESKTLYFGSCSVLQVPKEQVAAFRRKTRAKAVVGFTRDVNWLASAALDLILLEALAFNREGEAVEKWLRKEYGELAQHLGLRMFYDPEPKPERASEPGDVSAPSPNRPHPWWTH